MGFFRFIDEHKNKDSITIQFLKLGYSILMSDYVGVVNVAFGIGLPIIYESKKQKLFILGFGLLLLYNIAQIVCKKYYRRKHRNQIITDNIVNSHNTLIRSFWGLIDSDDNWQNTIFKRMAETICDEIYILFEKVQCYTRVSVECRISGANNKQTYKKMVARKSKKNTIASKKKVLLRKDSRDKDLAFHLFTNAQPGTYYYNFDDGLPEHWVIKKNKNVKQYLAIAIGLKDQQIDFILQIDSLTKNSMIKTESDVELFANYYLSGYANLLCGAYLLNVKDENGYIKDEYL